jgi:hypothetical protein
MTEGGSRQLENSNSVSEETKSNGVIEGYVVGLVRKDNMVEEVISPDGYGTVETRYLRPATTMENLTKGMTPEEKENYLKLIDDLFPSKEPILQEESNITPNRRAQLVLLSIITGLSIGAMSSLIPIKEASAAKPSIKIVEKVSPTPSGNEGVVDADPTIAALESMGYSSEYYRNRQNKIEANREYLLSIEEHEDRLDFCAEGLFIVGNASAFDDEKFIYPQKTNLRNYITEESIIEFYKTGKTGENWDVIYFKDEKGNKTEVPAIAYVYDLENGGFKISKVEEVIDLWETNRGAVNFLEACVGNGVRFIFHNQASGDNTVQKQKYHDGILYENGSGSDLINFQTTLFNGSSVDMFGSRGESLWGLSVNKKEIAVIKQVLAYENALYLYKKTGNEKMSSSADKDLWGIGFYLSVTGLDKLYIYGLVTEIKANNLMMPWAAETWQEIDEELVENNWLEVVGE